MASHVVVLDASFKRHTVKVTPGTSLRTILDETCTKFGLDPDQHVLKNSKDKQLDLSLPFRLSGLVSGAKLQLIRSSRSPSVVSIALQLPPSDGSKRIQDRFPSNTPLWLVLRKFEDTNKLNLTERSAPSTETGDGYLCYLQPCLNIMGRESASFFDLQKTLAQLGYNDGSLLIRLSWKNEGLRMEYAKDQITTYLAALQPKSQGEVQTESSHGAHAQPDMQLASAPNAEADNAAVPREDAAAQDPSEDTIMTPAPDLEPEQDLSLADQPPQTDDIIATSSETTLPSTSTEAPSSSTPSLSIYTAPSSSTPLAALQTYNEADYIPSVEHATAHQAFLTKDSQNKRLQSDSELAAALTSRQTSLTSIQSVLVRVKLPDQMFFDTQITQQDTSSSLYNSVRDMLANPSLGFKLRCPGPKGLPVSLDPNDNKKLITGLGIRGRVYVTMIWDEDVAVELRSPVLKQELVGQAKELKVEEPKYDDVVQNKAEVVNKKDDGKKKSGGGKGDIEAKMKKFLQFGKK